MVRPGIYNWIYKSGQFLVALRPSGIFYSAKYPGQATWSINSSTNVLSVDWKSYGIYEFPLTTPSSTATTIEGSVQGNLTNWRRLEFLRDFTATEQLLLGEHGYGSVWNFIYEKGSFEVEFRGDGYNHFNCPQYPAHSHWEIDENGVNIAVNWGKYGEYELRLAEGGTELTGHKKGQPSNWRRATFIRALTAESLASLPAHDHSHEHVHDGKCNH